MRLIHGLICPLLTTYQPSSTQHIRIKPYAFSWFVHRAMTLEMRGGGLTQNERGFERQNQDGHADGVQTDTQKTS
jgi:hypothetical protein